MNTLDTDYLVIGAGTAGLAFADTLISESDAHITLVDRRGKPGGHWNDAYSFVTLHQPSAFYGVNSLELGSGRKDSIGPNQGLHELASGAEVTGYFDRVLQSKLLPSGRVTWLPMSEYQGAGRVQSLLSGDITHINVRRKLVDANHYGPTIAATHTPRFTVAEGAALVPPNALPGLWHGRQALPGATLPRHFVVVGAGKTAMDTCCWLLSVGASASAITWVVPRDSWLINRRTTQPGAEFFFDAIGNQAEQMAALADATSIADLYLRLEACGALLRIDPSRTPTMFHLATISSGEVELLRSIRNVVRMGRVQAIAPDHMLLDQGRAEVAHGALYIDCTASAVEPRPVQPIFQDHKIVLQLVRLPQPAFSAALIAYVEAHGASAVKDAAKDGMTEDQAKNALCATVPFPHTLADYPRALAVGMRNQAAWGADKALRQWIRNSRLDAFTRVMMAVDPSDTEKIAVMARLKERAAAAAANLPRLLKA